MSPDPDMGTISVTGSTRLVHYTDKKWEGLPSIDRRSRMADWGGSDWRLIPKTFSLGEAGSTWRSFGKHALQFDLKRGFKMLTVTDVEFREWGKNRKARGVAIGQWSHDNGVDVVKLDIRKQDIEYAVLNARCIRRVKVN